MSIDHLSLDLYLPLCIHLFSNVFLVIVDIDGTAELIRLAFALSGIKSEDGKVQFPQWADLKTRAPHGHLPVLSIDDEEMKTQSRAIICHTGSIHPV